MNDGIDEEAIVNKQINEIKLLVDQGRYEDAKNLIANVKLDALPALVLLNVKREISAIESTIRVAEEIDQLARREKKEESSINELMLITSDGNVSLLASSLINLGKGINFATQSNMSQFQITDFIETSILYQAVLLASMDSGYLREQDFKKGLDKDSQKKDVKLSLSSVKNFPSNDQIMSHAKKITVEMNKDLKRLKIELSVLKKNSDKYKHLEVDISRLELMIKGSEVAISNLSNEYLLQTRASLRINKIRSAIELKRNNQLVINKQSTAETLYANLLAAIGAACSFLLPDEWNKSQAEKLRDGAGSSTGIFAETPYEHKMAEREARLEHALADGAFEAVREALKASFHSQTSDALNIDVLAKRQGTLPEGFSVSDMKKQF